MSIQEIIANAVEVAFEAAGDMVQTVQWLKQEIGEYDPAAGEIAVETEQEIVRALEDKITVADYNRLSLSRRAVKLLVPAADFAKHEIEPVFQDKLQHRGATYTVKECCFEGTRALWEIWADV